MDSIDKWMVQVRKGIAELCILNALRIKDRYGYDIQKMLLDVPNLNMKGGTIYPLLSRLKAQGLVKTRYEESPEGPMRKYYSLTPEGRKTAEMMSKYLKALIKDASSIK